MNENGTTTGQVLGEPRRGRCACQSRTESGRQAGDRPNILSGGGAWPRVT